MKQTLLISDTPLSLFIPSEVHQMIPELRQTCKCEIFLVCKYIHIYVKVSITKIVSYLKQKYVVRHILNSKFSTTCYAHYKDKNFPCDECLHAIIKDSAQ